MADPAKGRAPTPTASAAARWKCRACAGVRATIASSSRSAGTPRTGPTTSPAWQRALSETGDYTFTAPRERSGVMTPNLETAVTRYQRRTGPNPDGYVAPDGPTIQRVNAETEAVHGEEESRLPVVPRRKPVISNISSDQVSSLKPDPRYRETENSKTPKIKVAYISKIRRYGALAQEGATLAAEELNDAIFMNPKIEETRRRIQEIEQEIQRRRYGI